MYEVLTVLALFAFGYSVVASRLARGVVNGAVVYVAFGLLAGPAGFDWIDLRIGSEGVRTVAELTLSLVLFTDAANADLPVLRRFRRLPQRLLLVGLPLTIVLGVGAGWLVLPDLEIFEIAILATMLAPTDAALGQAVVTNPLVPAPVREGLNVESGLNDGICVPVLLTFLALAVEAEGSAEPVSLALRLVAEEIGFGLLAGLGLSIVAGWVLRTAVRRSWVSGPWAGIPIVALALACFALAQLVGGSGFIACFAGGLAFGGLTRDHKQEVLEGAEATGYALSLVNWVVFGSAVVGPNLHRLFAWDVVLYAALSLTIVRMLPVYLCVAGLGLPTDAKLFLGWFGPRGLASIVFGVIVFGAGLPHGDVITATVVVTVMLSVLAHGLTATPLASRFGAAHPDG